MSLEIYQQLQIGAKKDNNSNTYMTAGYHLELWLFSEESALKMVQNNPAACTLEPFRMDTEAERKIIIWLDCSETSRRSTGKSEAGQTCWGKNSFTDYPVAPRLSLFSMHTAAAGTTSSFQGL